MYRQGRAKLEGRGKVRRKGRRGREERKGEKWMLQKMTAKSWRVV